MPGPEGVLETFSVMEAVSIRAVLVLATFCTLVRLIVPDLIRALREVKKEYRGE